MGFHSEPRVWIVGDSIVHWAALLARDRREGNLGLPVRITWRGKRGLHLSGLRDYVMSFRHAVDSPTHVVIHAGSNDLGRLIKRHFYYEVAQSVYYISTVAPNVKVLWSDILPRVSYDTHPDSLQHIPDRIRRAVNKYARSIVRRVKGQSVKHPQFTHENRSLYYTDGVHLSDKGTSIFLNNLRNLLSRI